MEGCRKFFLVIMGIALFLAVITLMKIYLLDVINDPPSVPIP